MGRSRQERELFWRGVVQRQSESGLSVAGFCRQESISAPSLYAWRRKLREQDGRQPASDGQIEEDTAWGSQLLPVRLEAEASPSPVRILLPQGASIEAPDNIDRLVLVELLRALREAQLC